MPIYIYILSDPGIPGIRSMGPSLSYSVYLCANLTDVTLADEDTNSILTANREFQGNVAMRVTQPGGQLWNQALKLMQVAPSDGQFCNLCKLRHLMVKFVTNACGAIWWPNLQPISSGTIWWPNLEPMQVVPYGG